MRIGEVAADAAVNVQTLRYYERRGLIPTPARRRSGYREYDVGAVSRVRFIRHAQTLGFSLDEIAELLALRVDSRAACATVEARTHAAIARVDGQVTHLRQLRRVLVRLVSACRQRAPAGDCPILESLDGKAAS